MYNSDVKMLTVKELTDMVKNGSIIREGLQRTPSHDSKKATDILTSLYHGKYCGCLHLAKLESDGDVYSILDGSSRIQDLCDYIDNKEGISIKKEVFNSEKQDLEVVKVAFSKLKKEEQDVFLNYKFPVIILEDVNNAETFITLNSSTALSNIQKSKGNLSDEFIRIIDQVKNSNVIRHVLTDRQIQKDEVISITFQILSNIYGCYTASNKKLIESVKGFELANFDEDRFSGILSKFDQIDLDFQKYCFIPLISVLYSSPIELDKIPSLNNNVLFKVDTAGANSAPANDTRLKKASRKLSEFMGISVKTGRPVTKEGDVLVSKNKVDISDTTDLVAELGL